MRPCVVCGTQFEPYRNISVVCSPECRQKHRKQNQRAWYEANREITIERAKAQYRADPEGRKAYIVAWQANNPERIKSYQQRRNESGRTSLTKRAYYLANREVLLQKVTAYTAAHPEVARAAKRRYKKSDRGRLVDLANTHARLTRKRGAAGTASADQLQARWDYYEGKCWMCGKPATQWDHVIPVARGGANWPSNLRPACQPCNLRKNKRKPDECDWLATGS